MYCTQQHTFIYINLTILFKPTIIFSSHIISKQTIMKLIKTRLSSCISPIIPNNNNNNVNPMSPENSSKFTTTSSLQSHSSLQTLPSVPSLQLSSLLLDTVTVTHSLSYSITLPSSITSLSLSSTSSSSSSCSSLLYASCGHQINVYDSETFTLLETFNEGSPSSGAVKSIAFSNGRVLSAHQDGKIRVWKIARSKEKNTHQQHKLMTTLPKLSDRLLNFPVPSNHVQVRRHKKSLWLQHNDTVSSLAVTPSKIYSASWDKTFKTWSPSNLNCTESVSASNDAINAVTVSVDGLLYTGSSEGHIKVWNCTQKNKHELVATLAKHKSAVNALTLNKEGTILFSGACDRSILVWEREDSGNYMGVSGAIRGHNGAILCLICVHDFLISGFADKTVRIWRRGCEGKFSCLAVLYGHKKPVKCLAAKSEGNDVISVFSGGLDGEINVWAVRVNRC